MRTLRPGRCRLRTALRTFGAATLIALLPAAAVNAEAQSRMDSGPGAASTDREDELRQSAFRIRSDPRASLNGDDGWAAPVQQTATVRADRPFRLRFELEAGPDPDPHRFRLQQRRNGGPWDIVPAEDFPYPEKAFEVTFDGTSADFASVFEVIGGATAGGEASFLERAADGALRLVADRESLFVLARPPIRWRPSEFSLEFRLPERAAAVFDVVFLQSGSGDQTMVRLTAPDRVALLAQRGGQTRQLAERRFPFAGGSWSELSISFEEHAVEVELDDALLFEAPFEEQQRSAGTVAALRGEPRLGLQLAPDQVLDLRSIAIEGEARSPRVSIVSSPAFDHGAPTTDVLAVSQRPFTGGAGVSLADSTPPWRGRGGHGEWSFALVIRRFADQAARNEAGDRFEFRLVDDDGRPIPSARTAAVTLSVPDGHVGGTFVETPMRLGPWQDSAGALYFIMEPSETWNRMMVIRSDDGGRSWREVDGPNRPLTGDLEGLGSRFVDGRIHIVHQTSDRVLYHVFDTGDGPERRAGWVIRDELVAEPPEPPTQVADLAVRADGSVLAFYGAGNQLAYRLRSADGRWREARAIDQPQGPVLSGVSVVEDEAGVVHVAWTASDGSAWYGKLDESLSWAKPVRVAEGLGTAERDVGAILPLLYLPQAKQVWVLFRAADGFLYARGVDDQGRWTAAERVTRRPVIQSAVDSDQVAADAVVDGETVQLLFVDAGTKQLFHTARRDGRWVEAKAVTTNENVQWVRGSVILTPGGGKAYGFVYDAGSNGGSGFNRYAEIALQEGAP